MIFENTAGHDDWIASEARSPSHWPALTAALLLGLVLGLGGMAVADRVAAAWEEPTAAEAAAQERPTRPLPLEWRRWGPPSVTFDHMFREQR